MANGHLLRPSGLYPHGLNRTDQLVSSNNERTVADVGTGRKKLSQEEREERDSKFQRMYVDDGLPLEVIGGRLGWNPSTVRNALRRLNTPMRPEGKNYYSPYTWQGKARRMQAEKNGD